MYNFRALIIEDELPSARKLERLLSESISEVEVLDVLISVKQSINWLRKNEHPDVIFMDVHLADGLCFEIFKEIEVTSKIIFTTAFSNYSIKAFDYNSISYLLKPIHKIDLEKALEKASNISAKENGIKKLENMFQNFKTENFKTSFVVKLGVKIKIIKEEEITCFYSFENATYINTESFKGIINDSLSQLENDLDPDKFFRLNRTFIIQKSAIKDIITHSNSRFKININNYNESEIIISRSRVKEFKNWID
ncbi:MAG: LytTR family DNA-binding domain-containing protein [Polaribacter sp.]|nr:LytTR family DNA-binding domain-containing protein [Polaribacter sp.]MDG1810466.1 LytTR family DNA-binding domain-containing protein [Polaribacter sp.]MDG1994814.1 LytTR family DNA-binding domain-containing protein [Polaribacter sp.]